MTSIESWSMVRVLQSLTESEDIGCFDGSAEHWACLIAHKCSDDDQIANLLEEMEANGQLDPICITEDRVLGNGHHRLVLALLLGWHSILVDTSHWYSRASARHQDRVSGVMHPDADLFKLLSRAGTPCLY